MDSQEISEILSRPKSCRKLRADHAVTKEAVESVLSAYASGDSARSLVSLSGMAYFRVKKIIGLAGVHIRSKGEQLALCDRKTGFRKANGLKTRKLSVHRYSEMIKMYRSGVSWDTMEAEFGMEESNMRRLIKLAGVWREPAHRSYTLDDHFFDEIDSPPKAYFFGLLMADGCVRTTRQGKLGVVSISLKADDVHILEEFREAIGFSKELRDTFLKSYPSMVCNTQPQKLLSIHSVHMAESLNRIGCTPRKSHSAQYPHWLREDLHRHFIRGYFDGDGCVHRHIHLKTLRVDMVFNFVGSLHMMDGINLHLSQFCGFNLVKVGKREGCFLLAHGGNKKSKAMYRFLYGDGGFKLRRKFEVWTRGLQEVEEQQLAFAASKHPLVDVHEAKHLYLECLLSTPQIAKKLCTSVDQVRSALRRGHVALRSRAGAIALRCGNG